MTKSAVRLARTALAVGDEALPRYAARTSRHDYTQAQLFALLVLKHFLRTDYRGVVTLVAEWAELRRALRLPQVPHYSTLCYAARRLDAATFAALQAACFRQAAATGLTAPGGVVTADATGLERHHVSAHFVDRRGPLRGRRRRHWPKLTAVADVRTHLIAGAVVTRGPSQDSPQLPAAVRQAARLLAPGTLLGDAGYDAEHNHRLCRTLGITRSVIALNRRNTGRRWPRTPERRALRRRFPRALYGQRWHAESVFSRHKRRLGSALTSRRPRAQRREVLLRVLTHNLMILRRTR
ncbi:MAG TPA: IS5 family transposase [Gemmatirosa sp.]